MRTPPSRSILTLTEMEHEETQPSPTGPASARPGESETITQTGVKPHAALRISDRNTKRAEDDSDKPRDLPPSLRGRFERMGLLGQGGMGVVLRVRDLRLGRDVALKLLRNADEGDTTRFLREARAQAGVRHENVCAVYDAGEAGGQPYIVMQLIEGQSLAAARASMSLEQKILVVRKVAAAVHEAHRTGLIHRDLKPGNILVEPQEDGSLRPYVVDFGLARGGLDTGHTVTGAVLGTPAYMAPEQARGEIHALDRRTDVYSLGAVLYDMVTGSPPFAREQVWQTLLAVAGEEVPPLRSVKKDVPEDLETIVMKCLEREPRRRYESARALAEDLQRFLDGEPIQARRASMGRALWSKVRKHRVAAAFTVASLVAASSLTGVWLKGRKDAAEQARIAQKAGEDAKEMELFLRAAYELPLHDMERERALVRRRLDGLEERLPSFGASGQGPGHYALGRGYLALGDPSSARIHLEKARDAGFSTPELSYALGQTLGELYRREKERAERTADEGERKKKVAAIDVELRDPALAALKGATGAELSVPAYVEGLIAYYQGDMEQAISKARGAFQEAPWLYEAKKLEADALAAQGNPYGHDGTLNLAKMMEYYRPAAEAYALAGDIARSDPEVHRAECRLWTRTVWAEYSSDGDPEQSLGRALAACDRAVTASPTDVRTLTERAFALLARADYLQGKDGGDALPALSDAKKAAEEAARKGPQDVMARYILAATTSEYERERFRAGLDAEPERGRAAYEDVLALDPHLSWALHEIGEVDETEASMALSRGVDPSPYVTAALRRYDAVQAEDPKLAMPLCGKMTVDAFLVEDLLARGRSAEQPLSEIVRVLEELNRRDGQWGFLKVWRMKANRLQASAALDAGRDAGPFVAAARDALKAAGGDAISDSWLLREVGEVELVDARHADATGEDPEEPLRRGREAVRKVIAAKPTHFEPRGLLVRIEMVALRRALRLGTAKETDFDSAFEALRPLVAADRLPPVIAVAQAQIHALRAGFLLGHKRDASADIAAGLAVVEKALSKSPQMAPALATREELRSLLSSSRF
ncbi:MAG: serine/threonine-protein kinase [Polyangiaceae bacterium]